MEAVGITATREIIQEMVADWVPRLGLSHWLIGFAWDQEVGKPDDDRKEAVCTIADDYDQCTIQISKGFERWPLDWAEWVVVHELVHIAMRDVSDSVGRATEYLSEQAKALADACFVHAEEGFVDRISYSLVTLKLGRPVSVYRKW